MPWLLRLELPRPSPCHPKDKWKHTTHGIFISSDFSSLYYYYHYFYHYYYYHRTNPTSTDYLFSGNLSDHIVSWFASNDCHGRHRLRLLLLLLLLLLALHFHLEHLIGGTIYLGAGHHRGR